MLKILLVDDEREEREGIEYLIRKYNYPLAVSQAPNGKKALDFLEENPVDILFTDVKMPLMNGLELAKLVSSRYPGIRIIIFSAYGEFDYAKQAMEANAVNYLLKPIEVEEFCRVTEEVIRSILQEREQQAEKQQAEWQNRQNVMFRFLTGAQIQQGEWERAQTELFLGHQECRPVHVEFVDRFFEQKEELFLKLLPMYLGEKTEYVNLFENEAYLLVREKKYQDREFLEGQILKLVRDIGSFTEEESVFVVGRIVDSLEALRGEIDAVQEIQRELFAFGNMVLWTEREIRQEYFSRDLEAIRRQLLLAVEAGSRELTEKFAGELAGLISSSPRISKLYVQNMLYTVLRAVYDKYPDIRHEKLLDSSGLLFSSKSPREILRKFQENIRVLMDSVQDKSEDDSIVIQKIKNLVEKEYMTDIGLEYVAGKVHLAPAYVSYIFKKETGKTLIKYITDKRMEKAGELLSEGLQKISQVARSCGYENPSYFNRAFKNYYGVTPKQFRERENG